MDREVRRKLSTFFRSRWFEAPFDGDRFLELLFDGLRDMRQSDNAPSSLLTAWSRARPRSLGNGLLRVSASNQN